jgi:hypothetical protein
MRPHAKQGASWPVRHGASWPVRQGASWPVGQGASWPVGQGASWPVRQGAHWPVGAGLQPAQMRVISQRTRNRTRRPASAGSKPAATGRLGATATNRGIPQSQATDRLGATSISEANSSRTIARLLVAALLGLSLVAGRADDAGFEAVGIAVFPPRVQLDAAGDRQRIVVQARAADGRTHDVTAAAEVSLSGDSLASIDRAAGGLVLRPLADGDGMIRVAHAGHTAEIPLRVVSASTAAPLSFRLDVMPIFARAGCNMGSCHGAARGKDGFNLSLFGFDPAGDYHRITRELPGRRIDLASPKESLLFLKAVGGVPHTGGKRFEPDSDLAATLLRWLEAGVPDDPGPDPTASVPRLEALDLYPPTSLLTAASAPATDEPAAAGKDAGDAQQLVAVARFSDGTDRDVTDLCWYGSNNDRSVRVSAAGLTTGGARGEGFVMARYATITVGVPLAVIPEDLEFTFPKEPPLDGSTEGARAIDGLVAAKLASLRIEPSPVCDDETFLRRASLDLVGLLPTPEERAAFLADTAVDKRARAIDQLMARREFTDLWVMRWAEILQIRSQGNDVSPKGALLYHQWLAERIAANQPVGEMVRDLLTASGGTFEQPATNYFQLERNTLKLAENVAQAFLGMRIQCAQCHNHPFDRWTMDDYYGFAAFFSQVGRKRAADPRETIVFDSGGGEVPHPVTKKPAVPKFLGGEVPKIPDRGRREVVAAWITAPENPYFARHIANTIWTHFLGRGIVHEPDDARVSNPPANGPLLDELARRFLASGQDFRGLVRDICTSRTYQRSCEPTESNRLDDTNFARAAIRRQRAEVLLDVLAQVTDTKHKFPGLPLGARAVEVADGRTTNYFLTTFGRATRQDVCTCAVKMEPSLSQALHLLNGDVANDRIHQGNVVGRMLEAGAEPAAVLDALFIRCLCRPPTRDEHAELMATVEAADDKKQSLADIFWALLNSPEFIFNH